MKLHVLLSIYVVISVSDAFAPSHATTTSQESRVSTIGRLCAEPDQSRSDFIKGAMASLFLVAAAPTTASAASTTPLDELSSSLFLAKAYSSNARNMDRISAGDYSGGSVYDNNPSTPAARRRRAMQGCKIPSARDEAAEEIRQNTLAERDCNVKIMEESPDFMLKAMQTLDCPLCPYGVKESR